MILTSPRSPNTNPSILLVDDHPGVLYSTSKILSSHDFKVITAKNADQALAEVKKHNFDLIVCDINMPGRSGLEFLNDLKQYDPTIASVVLTSNGTVSMAIQAMKCGALGFVTKPFNEKELLESIQAALEQAEVVRQALQVEVYTPMLESLCNALLKTMEADDFVSEGGSQRVAHYAQDIANGLGLTADTIYQIYLAGLFHDIGKIGVPDRIVRKTDPLTSAEQAEMVRHPELGARIIEEAPGMREAALIVRHHHEWYDGTGYPNGLRGEEIPLGSRIVAVADEFEELTTRQATSHSPASVIQQIRQGSGTRFDPQVVEAAVAIFEQYQD